MALRRLFIPRKDAAAKNVQKPDYGIDMRAIETWAQNVGGIIEITTGTPGVLTITNPEGPTVNIDSTGGGGGSGSPGFMAMFAGPDDSNSPGFIVWFMPTNPTADLESLWPLFSNATGATRQQTVGGGWFAPIAGGTAAACLPEFTAPAYTGGPIGIEMFLSATDASWMNYAVYSTGTINIASGATYQIQTSDLTLQASAGADLSLVNGSGFNGVGIVSAGGGDYFGSTSGIVAVPTGVTFT